MTEPTTPLKALIIPNTGDLVGSWGTAAVNVDWTAVDGMLGGSQTISLASATTFSLSAPAGSITPGAGPNQAQNFMLQFTGTLTGNATITLPLPGFYVVFNNCTVGTKFIQFRAAGTGTLMGIPNGRQVKVWCDGTNTGLCDTPEVGSYLDLAASTTPSWYAGCTTLPYLICDGSTFSTSVYLALGTLLGSTFGGNGITTFGVPDLRARYRIPLDNQGSQGAANRVTAAGSSVNGTTLGSAGGLQNSTIGTANIPSYNLTVTDPGHRHTLPGQSISGVGNVATGSGQGQVGGTTGTATTGITVGSGGGGVALTTLSPAMVAGLALIKT